MLKLRLNNIFFYILISLMFCFLLHGAFGELSELLGAPALFWRALLGCAALLLGKLDFFSRNILLRDFYGRVHNESLYFDNKIQLWSVFSLPKMLQGLETRWKQLRLQLRSQLRLRFRTNCLTVGWSRISWIFRGWAVTLWEGGLTIWSHFCAIF